MVSLAASDVSGYVRLNDVYRLASGGVRSRCQSSEKELSQTGPPQTCLPRNAKFSTDLAGDCFLASSSMKHEHPPDRPMSAPGNAQTQSEYPAILLTHHARPHPLCTRMVQHWLTGSPTRHSSGTVAYAMAANLRDFPLRKHHITLHDEALSKKGSVPNESN